MREHVIRATETKGKRQSDIYYFAPDGTKLVITDYLFYEFVFFNIPY